MTDQATLLVVDDEEPMRCSLRAIPESCGRRMVKAAEGRKALHVFAQGRRDAVPTGLCMTGNSGFELATCLHELSPDTPLDVAPVADTLPSAMAVLRQEVRDCVVKLARKEEAVPVLRRSLGRGRLLAENRRSRERLEEVVEQRTRELRKNEATVRFIDAHLPGTIFQVRSRTPDDVMVTYLSEQATEILGISDRNIQSLVACVSPEDRPGFIAFYKEALLNPGRWQFEGRFRRPGGEEIHARCLAQSSLLDGEAVMDGIALDVTEAKLLEAQLLHAQRVVSAARLATGVAHDLNNVLTPMAMISGLLQERPGRPEEGRLLDTLMICARRAGRMVQQLLEYSRGSSEGRVELPPGRLVQETLHMLRETFPKNIVLRSRVAEDAWSIKADETQIHQVLLNLCINARDAMPDGGSIFIRLENVVVDASACSRHPQARPGPHIVFHVRDTGVGIAADALERIFEPFFTTKQAGRGTGLGLASVQQITRSHGGFVEVASELGAGTQFKVYLPAAGGCRPSLAEPAVKAGVAGQGEWIMIVDDDEAVRESLGLFLEAHGYRAFKAADGFEALATYIRHKDDIQAAVVDLEMPYMDGVETIQKLQKVEPEARVVAMTGLPGGASRAGTAGVAVRAFLGKPFQPHRLLEALADVLGKDGGREDQSTCRAKGLV